MPRPVPAQVGPSAPSQPREALRVGVRRVAEVAARVPAARRLTGPHRPGPGPRNRRRLTLN